MPDPFLPVYGRANNSGPMALRNRRKFVQQFVQSSDPGAGAWPAAWAGRATAPATWLALGDSITEGQGASVLGRRWVSQCLDLLRRQPGSPSTTGGVGWLAAASLVVGPDSAWTSPTSPVPVAGGTASLFNYFWQTTDGKGSTTNATNDTITWTIAGMTSVDTWVIDSSAPGTYQIDALSAVALNNGGNFPTLQVQHSAGVASGTHTVQIKQTGSGLIGIDGVFIYNGDESNGIHLYANGHYGALTTDILNDWGTGEAATFLKPHWSLIAPDAVTIGFGTNEFLNNIDPAAFKVSMRSVVRLLQALPKVPTVYLLAMPTYDDGVTQTFRWSAYQAALSALALETSGVTYVDVSTVTGPPTVGGLFSTDRIHPSDTGHALIGQLMSTILGGPIPAQFGALQAPALSPARPAPVPVIFRSLPVVTPSPVPMVVQPGRWPPISAPAAVVQQVRDVTPLQPSANPAAPMVVPVPPGPVPAPAAGVLRSVADAAAAAVPVPLVVTVPTVARAAPAALVVDGVVETVGPIFDPITVPVVPRPSPATLPVLLRPGGDAPQQDAIPAARVAPVVVLAFAAPGAVVLVSRDVTPLQLSASPPVAVAPVVRAPALPAPAAMFARSTADPVPTDVRVPPLLVAVPVQASAVPVAVLSRSVVDQAPIPDQIVAVVPVGAAPSAPVPVLVRSLAADEPPVPRPVVVAVQLATRAAARVVSVGSSSAQVDAVQRVIVAQAAHLVAGRWPGVARILRAPFDPATPPLTRPGRGGLGHTRGAAGQGSTRTGPASGDGHTKGTSGEADTGGY